MLQRLIFLLIALATATAGRQAANFNITSAQAEEYGCGHTCQIILNATIPFDRATVGEAFDFDFYNTANNFSSSSPGDVLKFKPINATTRNFRAGTTAYKFQYTSIDNQGSHVPVTGFIAFPYSSGGHGGSDQTVFPLVAFAHGTIGAFYGCAPSNGPNMFDYDTWQTIVSRGYAVVATDYAGLGNNYTPHMYLDFRSHAADIYYSVIAARKLFGHLLSQEWLSVGHSQGGGAVWKLAESEFVRHDAKYLGTVAMAPATYPVSMMLDNINHIEFPGYLPYLKLAAERAIPGFVGTMLSPIMRKRVEMAERFQLCASSLAGLTLDLGRKDLINSTGVAHDAPILLDWEARVAPASGGRSKGPILVVQGANDTSVLPPTTEKAWKKSCRDGNEVHIRLYMGVEHTPITAVAQVDWMTWINGRFSGDDSGHKQCTRKIITPFDAKWANLPPEFSL